MYLDKFFSFDLVGSLQTISQDVISRGWLYAELPTSSWSETILQSRGAKDFSIVALLGVSHLAAHQRPPQVGVPLLQARARSAPLAVHVAQSLPQLRCPLRSQVDGQHD